MNTIMRGMLLIAISTFSIESQAQLASYEWPGSACQAITPEQSKDFEWREYGLFNAGENTFWSMCPIQSMYKHDQQDTDIFIVVSNFSDKVLEVRCILRYLGLRFVALDAQEKKIPISSESVEYREWNIVNNTPGNITIACEMPPETAIYSIGVDHWN